MPEPITALTIAALAANKFVESGAGEVAKKLVGRLWEAVANRFKGDQRAELVLKKVEEDPGAANIEKLAGYLADEMELHGDFREVLEAIVLELQREPEVVQQMLVGVKVDGLLKAGNVRQVINSSGVQEMLKDVQAGSIELGDLTQEQ